MQMPQNPDLQPYVLQQQNQEEQQAQARPDFADLMLLPEEQQVAQLIEQVTSKLKEDRFDIKRRRTIALQSARKFEEINYGRLFEDLCTICLENFKQYEAILCPPCNHSFHHKCIMDVVESQSRQVVKDRMKNHHNQGQQQQDTRPDCPNCGRGILMQADEVEQTAVREINNIMGQLDSDS